MQSSWQKEIQKDYDDRKASVVWALADGNDIEKGIASELSYADTELKYISKKGIEIREKLNTEKTTVAVKLAESNIQLKTLKKSIGEEPIGHKDGDITRYDYKQLYPQQANDGINEVSVKIESNDKQSQMREYNNCIYKYNHCKKELKTLDTIINSINDKKEYKLPINIATELGF